MLDAEKNQGSISENPERKEVKKKCRHLLKMKIYVALKDVLMAQFTSTLAG